MGTQTAGRERRTNPPPPAVHAPSTPRSRSLVRGLCGRPGGALPTRLPSSHWMRAPPGDFPQGGGGGVPRPESAPGVPPLYDPTVQASYPPYRSHGAPPVRVTMAAVLVGVAASSPAVPLRHAPPPRPPQPRPGTPPPRTPRTPPGPAPPELRICEPMVLISTGILDSSGSRTGPTRAIPPICRPHRPKTSRRTVPLEAGAVGEGRPQERWRGQD